jgi:hypothetical protein
MRHKRHKVVPPREVPRIDSDSLERPTEKAFPLTVRSCCRTPIPGNWRGPREEGRSGPPSPCPAEVLPEDSDSRALPGPPPGSFAPESIAGGRPPLRHSASGCGIFGGVFSREKARISALGRPKRGRESPPPAAKREQRSASGFPVYWSRRKRSSISAARRHTSSGRSAYSSRYIESQRPPEGPIRPLPTSVPPDSSRT